MKRGMASSSSKLSAVRREIDRLDGKMLRLVSKRARLALKIGRIKKRKKWPVYDPKREAFVLSSVQQANPGPLSDASVSKIFQTILRQCRRRERSGKKSR